MPPTTAKSVDGAVAPTFFFNSDCRRNICTNDLYSLPKLEVRPAGQNNYHFLVKSSKTSTITTFVYAMPRSPIMRILLPRGRPNTIMGAKCSSEAAINLLQTKLYLPQRVTVHCYRREKPQIVHKQTPS